jgi:hypothetical protein
MELSFLFPTFAFQRINYPAGSGPGILAELLLLRCKQRVVKH